MGQVSFDSGRFESGQFWVNSVLSQVGFGTGQFWPGSVLGQLGSGPGHF